MTIGIGFRTSDGVVLCSDRQHTGATGFKFEKCKLKWSEHINGTAIIFCYAGEPEAAEVMFKKVTEGFYDGLPSVKGKITDPIDSIRMILGEVYHSPFTKGLETLIGVRASGEVHLYRTYERKVIDSHADCIGKGDSSVIRYLSERILGYHMNRDEAVVVGAYLVSVANRYVDGCSGGPDIFFLPGGVHSGFDPHANIQTDAAKLLRGKDKQFDAVERKAGEQLKRLLIKGDDG